jgi:ATP-dependent DNA helicase RecG
VINSEKGRVVIFNIPNRDIGRPFKFYGIPLMRIDDDLREMDDATHRAILLEQDSDFSAQICPQLAFEDLEPDALKKIKELWSIKSRNPEILNYSDDKILTELGLKTRQGFNYACLLLL